MIYINIEQELKQLLTENEYFKLDKLFDWEKVILQTNTYYSDREGKLGKHKITVRTRTIAGKHMLQIKRPTENSEQGALHIKQEFETPIAEIPKVLNPCDIEGICDLNLPELYPIGTLVTERKLYHFDSETEICLDRNEYLGIIDYELEIEFAGSIKPEVLELFAKHKIMFDKKCRGKYSRFNSALRKI